MSEKVTLQAISDIFSSQYKLSKKITDPFGKSFFDTIVDGLNQDGQVSINGLGTFRIVEVSSRESINVTNGERILLDGYRKVAFTPDELLEWNMEKQKNQAPEEEPHDSVEQSAEEVTNSTISEPVMSHEEALQHFISNNIEEYEGDDEDEYENVQRRKRIRIGLMALILIMVCVAGYLLYRTTRYQVNDMTEPETQEVPDTITSQDSLSYYSDTTDMFVP